MCVCYGYIKWKACSPFDFNGRTLLETCVHETLKSSVKQAHDVNPKFAREGEISFSSFFSPLFFLLFLFFSLFTQRSHKCFPFKWKKHFLPNYRQDQIREKLWFVEYTVKANRKEHFKPLHNYLIISSLWFIVWQEETALYLHFF